MTSDRTRDSAVHSRALLRALPFAGFAAIAAIALAWGDLLPGGYRLRGLVGAEARDRRELALHAAERLSSFAATNARIAPGSVVFVGSSTIERFPLAERFPGKPCVNHGILSASVPMIERFLDVLAPSVPSASFVLYAGSIDLRDPDLTHAVGAARRAASARADEVAAQVRALLDDVRREHPDAAIALIGVLPARRMSAEDVVALARLNASLHAAADERGIAFVDTARAPITSPAGSLAEDQSADDLHLDEHGYATLAAWIVSGGGEPGRRLAP